jgi:predicted RNase H-like nuclease
MLPPTGAVLGIDVGWSNRRKSTCLCLLRWDRNGWRHPQFVALGTDRAARTAALLDLVGDASILSVAIDGPLIRGLTKTTEYRPAEALLSRGLFQRRGKPGPTNSPSGQGLHREATDWAWLAVDHLHVGRSDAEWALHRSAVYEAFPNAFLAVLHDNDSFPARAARKRKWTDTLFPIPQVQERLRRLYTLLRPEFPPPDVDGPTDHDEIAAYVCALTALCVLGRKYVAVGDNRLGFIVLPPVEVWGRRKSGGTKPWAEEVLAANVLGVGGTAALWRDGRRWTPGP